MSFAATISSCLLILSIAWGIHLKGLDHKFAFDDAFAITGNGDVLGSTPWKSLLAHDFWGADIKKQSANKSYRPVTVALWRLLHAYTRDVEDAEPKPWWFHTYNVVLHGVVSLQVFFFARQLARIFGYERPLWRALVAALLFAAHPVHVEVVIGCVGVAEILCASLGIMALQLMLCNDEAFMRPSMILRTLLGFILIFIATLSKEIGITLCGTLALWDGMVIPYLHFAKVKKDVPPAKRAAHDEQERATSTVLRRFLVLRIILAAALVFGYKYGLRRYISGGKDLVASFRRQENPFAFAADRQTLCLSVMFNHASYAWLLVYPRFLSADYSFACTDYVVEVLDRRNVASGLLYVFLLLVLLRARPWAIAGRALAVIKSAGGSSVVLEQAFLIYGLMVIPFMPATNLFFWVGTAMGERLLYFPSLGFLLFASHVIVGGSRVDHNLRKIWRTVLVIGRVLLVTGVMGAYIYRTMDRVWDWYSEEDLFRKAYEVCPNSGKVLQNMGIVMQHEKKLDKALDFFRTAASIDPSCCDFPFFVSQTLLMQGKFDEGLPGIHKAAVSCRTERQKSLEILGQVMQQSREGPFEAPPELYQTQKTIGLALLQDEETGDPPHGCTLLENSLWSRVGSRHPQNDAFPSKWLEQEVKGYMTRCLEFTSEVCELKYQLDKPNATPATKCIKGRISMIQAMARHGRKSEQLYTAAYKYLKVAKGLGCIQNPTYERMEELCGVKRGRLVKASYTNLAKYALGHASDGRTLGGSTISDSHRTAVHVVQSDDPMNPWFHLAWSEVLILEGRVQEAIRHLNVGGSQLATGLREEADRVNNPKATSAKRDASDPDYTVFLRTPMATTYEEVSRVVKSVTGEMQELEKLLAAATPNMLESTPVAKSKASGGATVGSHKGNRKGNIIHVQRDDSKPTAKLQGKGSGGGSDPDKPGQKEKRKRKQKSRSDL